MPQKMNQPINQCNKKAQNQVQTQKLQIKLKITVNFKLLQFKAKPRFHFSPHSQSTMSKILIINKLSKCNAYEYSQNPKPLQDSTSKVSTSTRTQESPTIFTLNPQFTFKATDLKQALLPKPKAQQFFQTFNPTHQVIYQKVVLSKFKLLERSLEFELLNLSREADKSQDNFGCRKLQFYENQSPTFPTIPVMENIEVRQTKYRIPEYIKTQYNQAAYVDQFNDQNQQNNYKQYFQSIPYDSKKYKVSRQKIGPFKQQNNINDQKRCQTQTNETYSHQTFEQNKFTTFPSQQQQKDEFDDYHFVTRQLKESKREPLHQFNDYYINANLNFPKRDQENPKSIEKTLENHRAILLSRRSGNSSRLSFFRKERQHHLRKSLLEDYSNGQNNSKRSILYSNQNKQNIKSNIKIVPTLAFNNLSKAAQKKLKNQYSQRFLLGRRHLQDPMQSSKATIPCKGSVNCMSKQTQNRIMSIRKQLREIYNGEEKEKCRLKILRDQETYSNNAKNSLRRVGSICKF